MGLVIEDNIVKVDHDVKDHLITVPEGNPSQDIVHGLKVLNVFRRQFNSAKLARSRHHKVIGDNCPLIYALKKMDGLSVEFKSIKKLNESLPEILERMAATLAPQCDVIVSMPSSSPLASMLGKRLSRATGKPHIRNLFVKSTNTQASASVALELETAPKNIPRQAAVDIRNVLKKLHHTPNSPYTAKSVTTSVRKYFVPLSLTVVPPDLTDGCRILLVDDLLSTGETLKCAERLLRLQGFIGPHVAAAWFSKVGK